MGAIFSTLRKSGYISLTKAAGIFRFLFLSRRNNNAIDTQGWSQLHSAILNGEVEIAKHLIENSAELTQNNPDGHTPLTSAIKRRHDEIMICLVEHGASVDYLNERGW